MQNYVEDNDMIRINKKKFLLALFTILLAGILIGQGMVQAKPDTYDDLKMFTQALELIKRKYVENPDSRELIYGAVKGMVSSLDPHSSFMPPKAYKEMDIDMRGARGSRHPDRNQELPAYRDCAHRGHACGPRGTCRRGQDPQDQR